MALLNDLVREHERKGAGEMLGVDPRTLGASLDRGILSRRVRVSLERLLLHREAEEVARQRQRIEELEERVGGLTEEMRSGRLASEDGLKTLRQEWTQTLRQVTEWEAHRAAHSQTAASGSVKQPAVTPVLRRRYPELVTTDPAADDEEVYGEAWTLVEEWRALWQVHPTKGTSLSWLVEEERIRELEVAMLEEHGLTLPPEKKPLTGLWRRSQLNWRRQALYDTRRARVKRELLRWVRRILTVGRWRK